MNKKIVVLKFGGTSVSTKKNWLIISDILRRHIKKGHRVIVVCSALSGISNKLENILKNLSNKNFFFANLCEIKNRYNDFSLELGVNPGILTEDFSSFLRVSKMLFECNLSNTLLAAEFMAYGELLLTKIAVEFLRKIKISTHYQDARNWLHSIYNENHSIEQNYMNAVCNYEFQQKLVDKIMNINSDVILTQGFIAKNSMGETVLLGRGGSDTSAAYLAAKLAAIHCEIWTDVQGIYTCDPREITSATLLARLSFQEAREAALAGAKVLHHRCIDPLERYGIPLHVRCTSLPESEGTLICNNIRNNSLPIVKVISLSRNISFITARFPSSLKKVSFIEKVFLCFNSHSIEIDSIATTEDSITLFFKFDIYANEKYVLESLIKELRNYCEPELISNRAVINLVGENIYDLVEKVSSFLSVLKDRGFNLAIRVISNSRLSVIVDPYHAENILRDIHSQIFSPV